MRGYYGIILRELTIPCEPFFPDFGEVCNTNTTSLFLLGVGKPRLVHCTDIFSTGYTRKHNHEDLARRADKNDIEETHFEDLLFPYSGLTGLSELIFRVVKCASQQLFAT
jgi:hypothetical protein